MWNLNEVKQIEYKEDYCFLIVLMMKPGLSLISRNTCNVDQFSSPSRIAISSGRQE